MKAATIFAVVALAMFCLYMAIRTDSAIGSNAEEAPATQPAGEADLSALPIKLPRQTIIGTPPQPPKLSAAMKLDLRERLPAILAPKGVVNLALNRPVSSSDKEPIIGKLEMITDGDKEAGELSFVELNPGSQWVQIDLGKPAEIWGIAVWHEHEPRIYKCVVVQVSNDRDFITGVSTLYNNDVDNSLGMGVGSDMMYWETYKGRMIEGKGTKAQYVRLYSKGHLTSDENRYTEVEVYGR